MKINTKVTGGDNLAHALEQLKEKVARSQVLVGLPESTGNYGDGTPIVVIGAVQEFGGNVNHPGGTSYGYKTEDDAKEGNVRFLAKGSGFMELGKTKPHVIKIPERSFLRVPLRSAQKVFANIFKRLLPKVLSGELTEHAMLSQVGMKAVAISQEAIASGIPPPNAPSTIRQKGGKSTPLVDTGVLKSSITYVIKEAG
jgi:hypothetical protein